MKTFVKMHDAGRPTRKYLRHLTGTIALKHPDHDSDLAPYGFELTSACGQTEVEYNLDMLAPELGSGVPDNFDRCDFEDCSTCVEIAEARK